MIKENAIYSKAKTAYFLDKDFDGVDDHPNSSDVYITPCYSVENLYVTETVFKRILRSEFSLNEQADYDGTFMRCLDLFRDRLREFLDAVQLANAWILFHRNAEARDRENSVSPARLNLGSLNLNQMVDVSLEAVNSTYCLFDLETTLTLLK